MRNLLIFAILPFILIGCLEGPTGPQGPKGAQGAQGEDGTNGTTGKAGNDGKNAKYTSFNGTLKSLPFSSADGYWKTNIAIANGAIVSVVVRPNSSMPWKVPQFAYMENNSILLLMGYVMIFEDAVVNESWEYRITIAAAP